jgi:hypothetical protein
VATWGSGGRMIARAEQFFGSLTVELEDARPLRPDGWVTRRTVTDSLDEVWMDGCGKLETPKP